MTAFRRYRPIGSSQLRRMEGRLASAAREWSSHWFGNADSGALAWHCGAPVELPRLKSGQVWRRIGGGDRSIHLPLSAQQCFAGVALWFGAEDRGRECPEGTQASAELFAKVFENLLQRCVASVAAPRLAVADGEWPPDAPVDEYLGPAAGAIQVQLQSWFGDYDLVFSPALAAELSRAQEPSSAARERDTSTLSARSEVLADKHVALSVGAALAGRLTVGAVEALAVGDVLLLERKISQPWEIVAASGAPIAHGFLGRKGDRYALRLTKAPSTQG